MVEYGFRFTTFLGVSVCLSGCLACWLAVCLSVWLAVCLAVWLTVCLSIYLSIYLSLSLSLSFSLSLSMILNVHPLNSCMLNLYLKSHQAGDDISQAVKRFCHFCFSEEVRWWDAEANEIRWCYNETNEVVAWMFIPLSKSFYHFEHTHTYIYIYI